MSELAVMDSRLGDAKIEWDPGNSDEVTAAREMFNQMKAKQYLAYSLDETGRRGEVLRQFDPDAERIIMSPQMQGG